jgi:diaminohydroxyphosphoribosylaminopyrimidine deaminase/5-amino-6-(5-phosphoribosylamino)uracil reductase
LIEGGSEVLNHFIENGLWDEARIFKGKIDYIAGVKAPAIKGIVYSSSEFESSTLETLINDHN